jgi:outer membrane protein assembly factor BamA
MFYTSSICYSKLIVIAGILFFTKLQAQEQNTPSFQKFSTLKNDTATCNPVVQKDITDVLGAIFKKNTLPVTEHDPLSKKPVYAIVPAIGYSLQTKLAAVISGNVLFYLSPDAKPSTISANATFTQNKQIFAHILSNNATKNNTYKFVGDLRFYKYPQSTFGLGSSARIENEDPMDYDYFRFYQTVFKKIKGDFFIGAGYNIDHHWRISHEGPINGARSDYAKYGKKGKTTSSGLTFNTLFDSRDNPINARTGMYSSVQLRTNFQAIGSNSNWHSIIIDLRKYFPFPAQSKNTLAFWSYNTVILSGKPPYLDLPSTGWDSYNSTGRGFIQGRYRGTKMVYVETEYRFAITPNGLLGGAVFANGESFSGGPKSKLETLQPGFGAGVRIKLNKLSNTNLAIDYGFGTEGSKGLFITVGELF